MSGNQISRFEISKEIVVTARSVSSEVMPGLSLKLRMKLERALCSIMTPLGLPVDPEV
jgi:hypothetical protein